MLGQQGGEKGGGGTCQAGLFLEPRSLPPKWAQCSGLSHWWHLCILSLSYVLGTVQIAP